MGNNIKLWAGVGVYLLVGTPAGQAGQAATQAPAADSAAEHGGLVMRTVQLAQAPRQGADSPNREGGKAAEGGEGGGGPVRGLRTTRAGCC